MKQVTKEIFFATLTNEENKGKDIMPKIENDSIPYSSLWIDKRTKEVFGKTVDPDWSKGESTTKFFLNS